VNALDVLRFVIAATGFRLTASEKALADLDALVQATEDWSHCVSREVARAGGPVRNLLDALDRVKGET
jgi:hypothetical protein